jgi:hypothetical protein
MHLINLSAPWSFSFRGASGLRHGGKKQKSRIRQTSPLRKHPEPQFIQEGISDHFKYIVICTRADRYESLGVASGKTGQHVCELPGAQFRLITVVFQLNE